MAIIYPLTLPSTPGFRRMTPRAMNAVGLSISPFTYAQQVQEWAGEMLGFGCELPPMDRATAAPWEALLLALRGVSGTVLLGPPQSAPLGVGTGSPQVNGDSQTGKTFALRGWTASQTGILKAADWLQAGRNYLTFPAAIDNAAWSKTQCTVTANSQTAPDGTATADRVTPDAGATAATVYQAGTLPSGLKVGSRQFRFGVWLRAASGTPTIDIYILDIYSGNTRGSLAVNLTTSWQFFSVVGTMDAAHTTVLAQIGGTDSWVVAEGAVDVWGAYLDATDQDQRLYANVRDVNSNSNGLTTADIFPRLRLSHEDFSPITVVNPRGTFRLRKNLREWEINQALHRGMAFEVIEAL